MAILLSEGLIVTMLNEEQPQRGYVGIVNNRIDMVSYDVADSDAFISKHPEAEVINCRGRVVMPGLINTHTHVSMTLMRNYADNKPIQEWLNDYIWVFEAKQTNDDIVAGAKLGMAEMLLGGTTSIVDMYMTSYNIASAALEMGIRARMDECVIVESHLDSTMDNLSKCRDLTADCSRLSIGIGPHAPYTCTPKMLERTLSESEKCNLPICTHLCEGKEEREMIYKQHGLYPVQYLDKYGVITDHTLLAHSIHLSDEDIELIAQRGASVSHSPQSNMKLASGVARVVDLVRAGVNVTLSTDGACSNNDLDMWEEMRTALLLQRVTTLDAQALMPYDVLQMATVNGAKALGMEGELGVIKQGALADVIVVNMTAPHLMPNGNIHSALIFCAKSSDVEHVIVDGKQLVSNHQLIGVDTIALAKEVVKRKNRILSELA
ncbi:MAG: amidohydrolase [Rikenellaceae bacterium]